MVTKVKNAMNNALKNYQDVVTVNSLLVIELSF